MAPIVVKSWRFPHTEVPWPFVGAMANAAIAMLVLDRWRFADYAFPLYIFLVCALTVAVMVLRKRAVEQPALVS